jgi:hypothetical protein
MEQAIARTFFMGLDDNDVDVSRRQVHRQREAHRTSSNHHYFLRFGHILPALFIGRLA